VIGSPVNGRRLHEAVVDQFVRQIVGGQLQPGALLPTEGVLAEQFGVSRTVLREAMRLLAAKGLVKVKHGSGVWVQPPDEWDRLDTRILFEQVQVSRDSRVLDDVLEVRRFVEVELAGLAALRRGPEDLTRLGEAIEGLRAKLAATLSMGDWDLEFHDRIYRAAKNPILRKTARPVTETLFSLRRLITNRLALNIELSQRGHEAIYAAVAAGDDAAARSAMAEHVAQFETELRASDLF
jgi:GntR family transcriptional repressor for pyruvate dehydrogenase complex